LIPTEVSLEGAGAGGGELRRLAVGSIRPNRNQPRLAFDEEALAALAASIAEVGVLQPILVRPLPPEDGAGPDAQFELIAGERRWRAAKRVGLPTIPALVREATDLASMEQAVIENLHRRDLNPMEEAAAYQQLLEDFGLTHEVLAKRVGKSRTAVTNLLRLFQLPPALQRLVRDAVLSEGHARALLGVTDRARMEEFAEQVVAGGLSVRATEELVRQVAARPAADGTARPLAPAASPDRSSTPREPGRTKEAGLLELEHLLGDLLATRVTVELGQAKGRVVIEFADLDDLERIYRAMTGS